MLEELQSEAAIYISTITSKEALDERILNDLKYNKNAFIEAIVLVHINESLTIEKLSDLIDFN